MSDAEVLFERRGKLGLVTLNRPRALNTLTIGMVRSIDWRLRAWADEAGVAAVVIRATGSRAFSAGGDIRALYELGTSGRYAEALSFWREEYILNTLIKEYPKPYIALIQGVVMGGGAGVAMHGSHRVAAGAIAFAMPEVGIGFFPDVGATFFLPRLPPGVGMWLALTGRQLGAADALALGVLTHHIPASRADGFIDALAGGEAPDTALSRLSANPGNAPVAALLPDIARLFAGDSVEAILAALDAEAADSTGPVADLAGEAAAAIRIKSPTSLKIAFAQMRLGAALDFRAAMRTEYRIAARIVRQHDLYEGIRATVIDKDNAPRWRPGKLGDVRRAEVEAYFAALPREEPLVFPELRPKREGAWALGAGDAANNNSAGGGSE